MPEQPLAEGSIYVARPAILVDGQAQPSLDALLQAMELREDEMGLASLELRYMNTTISAEGSADFAFESSSSLLSLGRRLELKLGDENNPTSMFTGLISGIELVMQANQQPELVVLAEDSLQRARLARRTQVYRDLTVGDLVQQVASRLGLRARVDGLNQQFSVLVQLNESDLAFVRRVLASQDAQLHMDGNEMVVVPRHDRRESQVTLEFGSQLLSISALADLAHQVSEVTASGWDVANGQTVSVSNSGAADLGPGSGQQGSEILRNAFSTRAEHLGSVAVADEPEATALANAHFSRRARRFVRVKGTAEGNPNLRVGSHVTLNRLGPRFDNTYYVCSVRHRFDLREGYRTDFEAECAYLGR